MNDRELLEWAAKAAGFEKIDYSNFDGMDIRYGFSEAIWNGSEYWNPLTDDGYALRLAVKLNIQHSLVWNGEHDEYDTATASRPPECRHIEEYCGQRDGVDIYSATRRAIVRAAAEIGNALEGRYG